MESAARGGAEINKENMYKMGVYSFKSLKIKDTKRIIQIKFNKTKTLRATNVEISSMDK